MATDNALVNHETLDKNLWETSAARFNAAQRLQAQSRLSLWAAAALSVAAAMWSLAAMLRPQPAYTLLAMWCSLGALALSLVESAADHGARAERLHRNALDLRALMRECRAMPLADALARQRELLASCPENHASADWRLAIKGRDSRAERVRYRVAAYGWRAALLAAGAVLSVAAVAVAA